VQFAQCFYLLYAACVVQAFCVDIESAWLERNAGWFIQKALWDNRPLRGQGTSFVLWSTGWTPTVARVSVVAEISSGCRPRICRTVSGCAEDSGYSDFV